MSSDKQHPDDSPNLEDIRIDGETLSDVMTEEAISGFQDMTFDSVLKGVQCYEVLERLYQQSIAKIWLHRDLIDSLMSHSEEVQKHLNDPQALYRYVRTLITDINRLAEQALALHRKHNGQSGRPLARDWPIVFMLASQYDQLLNETDQLLGPTHNAIVQTLRLEYPEFLNQ